MNNYGIVFFDGQIKPCPFCGKDPVMVKDIRYPRPECKATDAYEIVCNTFGCPIYKADKTYFFSQHAAVAARNTRMITEPPKGGLNGGSERKV